MSSFSNILKAETYLGGFVFKYNLKTINGACLAQFSKQKLFFKYNHRAPHGHLGAQKR